MTALSKISLLAAVLFAGVIGASANVLQLSLDADKTHERTALLSELEAVESNSFIQASGPASAVASSNPTSINLRTGNFTLSGNPWRNGGPQSQEFQARR